MQAVVTIPGTDPREGLRENVWELESRRYSWATTEGAAGQGSAGTLMQSGPAAGTVGGWDGWDCGHAGETLQLFRGEPTPPPLSQPIVMQMNPDREMQMTSCPRAAALDPLPLRGSEGCEQGVCL